MLTTIPEAIKSEQENINKICNEYQQKFNNSTSLEEKINLLFAQNQSILKSISNLHIKSFQLENKINIISNQTRR